VQIDVKTKIIADNTRILAVHAGERRRYFSIFKEESLVFLELPGFTGGAPVFDNIRALRQHIRASEAIAQYAVTDRSLKSSRTPPERRASSYDTELGDAAFNRFVGTVRSLYSARSGDIILVPSYGGQYSETLVGEVAAPFAANDKIALDRYGGESVPFRRVKWLPVHPLRRQFSVALSRRLENRTAATEINREEFGREVFSVAYKNFSAREISKIEFSGNKYEDPYDLLPAAKLVRYFVAACNAIDANRTSEISSLSVDELIASHYQKESVESFGVTFASPGKLTLMSLGTAVGLVVLAGIGASMYSQTLTSLRAIQVTNSQGSPNDPVTEEAAYKFDLITNAIGGRQLKELNVTAKSAQKDLELKSDAVIEPGPP
jgi:hypothetical protein